MPTLIIANRNYSSWSMRAWLTAMLTGAPFNETPLSLSFDPGSAFKQKLATFTPTGRVPVWVDDDGLVIWDSLAIAETLAERYPQQRLWPLAAKERARARSLCAEMHSGFMQLRTHCPMNIELHDDALGARLLTEQPGIATDLQRIDSMWTEQLKRHGGPFLFGSAWCLADVFYAPVCMRIASYGLPLSAPAQAYLKAVFAHEHVQAWVKAALAEKTFIPENEPYRQKLL